MGELTGTVSARAACGADAGNGPCTTTPVAGADISVTDANALTSRTTTVVSESDGSFRLALPAGRYQVTASRPPRRQAHAQVDVTVGHVVTVRLTLGSLNRHPMRATAN